MIMYHLRVCIGVVISPTFYNTFCISSKEEILLLYFKYITFLYYILALSARSYPNTVTAVTFYLLASKTFTKTLNLIKIRKTIN